MVENLLMLSDHFLQKTREDYCEQHSSCLPSELSSYLKESTRNEEDRAHMISGALQGALLIFFSKLLQPQRILELGTFTAYSTICLAQGLAPKGKITSIEKESSLRATIEAHLQQAGVRDQVELRFGDVSDILPELKASYDLIFVDAAKRKYKDYVMQCLPILRTGGVLIIDNVLFKNQVMNPPRRSKISKSISSFNDWVSSLEQVTRLMLPIRDGITLLIKN